MRIISIPYIQRNPRTMSLKGTHKVPQSNAQGGSKERTR